MGRCSRLEFDAHGLVVGREPPDWLGAVARAHQLKLDFRLRPATAAQWGEVLTIGGQGRSLNLSIGQKRRSLMVRLRRTCRPFEWLQLPCTTTRIVRGTFDAGRSTDVQLLVRPSALELAVDGEVVIERTLSSTPLAVWDVEQRIALGNAVAGDRPWLGAIESAALRVPGVEVDLLDPDHYRAPQTYWAFDRDPRVVPFRDAPLKDMRRNLIMYVPFGALLALLGFWQGS